ncbi:hypothetical protein CBL_05330 [Carabus blaptoides fortunei]
MEQVTEKQKEEQNEVQNGNKFWTQLEILQCDTKSLRTDNASAAESDDKCVDKQVMTLKEYNQSTDIMMVNEINSVGTSGHHQQPQSVCKLEDSSYTSLSPSTVGSRSPPPYSGYGDGYQQENRFYDSRYVQNGVGGPSTGDLYNQIPCIQNTATYNQDLWHQEQRINMTADHHRPYGLDSNHSSPLANGGIIRRIARRRLSVKTIVLFINVRKAFDIRASVGDARLTSLRPRAYGAHLLLTYPTSSTLYLYMPPLQRRDQHRPIMKYKKEQKPKANTSSDVSPSDNPSSPTLSSCSNQSGSPPTGRPKGSVVKILSDQQSIVDRLMSHSPAAAHHQYIHNSTANLLPYSKNSYDTQPYPSYSSQYTLPTTQYVNSNVTQGNVSDSASLYGTSMGSYPRYQPQYNNNAVLPPYPEIPYGQTGLGSVQPTKYEEPNGVFNNCLFDKESPVDGQLKLDYNYNPTINVSWYGQNLVENSAPATLTQL